MTAEPDEPSRVDDDESEAAEEWRIHRPDGSRPWMPRFLELLAETLDVRATCKAVNTSHPTAYRSRKRCQWFRERWDEIISTGVLEPARAEICRRAIWGTPNAVMREVEVLARNKDGSLVLADGKPVRIKEWQAIAYETVYETALTKMFAERRIPEYAPTVTGIDDKESGVLMVPTMLSEDEWREVVQRRKQGGA